MLTNKEQGAYDANAFYTWRAYASLPRDIRAEEAIKLFLPPVTETMVQYVAPMPKDRKDWIKGFKQEQIKHYPEDNET